MKAYVGYILMACEENAERNSSTDVGINPLILFGYVVVKLALGRTMMAQRGSTGIPLLFL